MQKIILFGGLALLCLTPLLGTIGDRGSFAAQPTRTLTRIEAPQTPPVSPPAGRSPQVQIITF